MHMLLTHLDWIGMWLGILGAWPASSARPRIRWWGFLIWIISDIFWIGYGATIGSQALVYVNLWFVLMSARGVWNAHRQQKRMNHDKI